MVESLTSRWATGFLFPAKHANKPISSQALAKWLHEQSVFRNRLVAHGLRSIGRSWFADNDVPSEIAEAEICFHVYSFLDMLGALQSSMRTPSKKPLEVRGGVVRWKQLADKAVVRNPCGGTSGK